ncbi:MAG TPA: DUF4293 domain-containing protein [Bacteroidales bacterium]|nr:DUF4293 domain-containing protein [Bacteroidales bacterium]
MLQRIQSVYLFLAFVAGVLLFVFPLAVFDTGLAYYKFYIYSLKDMVPGSPALFQSWFAWPLIILTAAICILTLESIFLYKNRIKQMLHIKIGIFLTMLLIVLIFFVYMTLVEKKLHISPDYHGIVGIYLPVATLVFLVLAYQRILHDEKLVRSADRLR